VSENQDYKNLLKGFISEGLIRSLREFAIKSGIDYPSLSLALKGKRGFSAAQIRAIEQFAKDNLTEKKEAPQDMDQVAMLKEQIQMLKDLVQAQKELSGSALIETKDKMIKMLEEENERLKRRLREQGNAENNGTSKAS
jgi:predicted transcriptional regulator